jgi:hypothetical protein
MGSVPALKVTNYGMKATILEENAYITNTERKRVGGRGLWMAES